MRGDQVTDGAAMDEGWLSERACQFGDGLFETVAVIGGRPCLWDRHLARLLDGCRRLLLPQPDIAQLTDAVMRLCHDHDRVVLKLFWTAGQSERGYRRPSPVEPRLALRLSPWPVTAYPAWWRVRWCAHRLSDNPALAGIKHLNRLDQVIARAEWSEPQIDEGLMLDQTGHAASGTMSNLFLQHGGDLVTPSLDRAGISGVVRGLICDLAGRRGIVLQQREVSPDEVRGADAVYLTNSLIGVRRVGQLAQQAYDHAVTEHPLLGEARMLCHQPAAGGGSE